MSSKVDKLFEHSCRPDSMAGVCRSRGGESCAFDGAMIVLGCIADAAHLVHGPIACCGNSWESRGTVSDKGVLHKRAYTTDVTELDIVYGAEEKLLSAIRATVKDSGAKAIFVYATCVTGMIGEDIDAVCKRSGSELGVRVIAVHAPGFIGPKNLGNRIAGQVLLDTVIGTAAPGSGTQTDINLIGEYNIAGDLALVEPLLKKAGINVRARLTGNATFDEVARAHGARLNAVVCGRALINVAREMEVKYGIPFVEVSFFGRTETTRALLGIAEALERRGADIIDRVRVLVDIEEQKLADALKKYGHLAGKKAVLYTGGVKSWSFISALADLGIEVVAVGAKKATAEDEEKMRALLGPKAPIIENTAPANLLKIMRERCADILVAGGRNQYLAIKEGFPFVDVNQERHTAYAGYAGLLNLAEAISAAIRFYERKSLEALPRITRNASNASVNPLKHSASIGAAMALQGVDKAAVVLHGAQGCNFLGKVLLTKHFREPIAMASSKLFAEDVVLGSEELLTKTVEEQIEKNSPALVCVLTTGLTEVKGENVEMALAGIARKDTEVLYIPTPDYKGGLEEGYATAVERLAAMAMPSRTVPGRVNILAGTGLTPADVNELRDIVESFGLGASILPDLSALDGSRVGFSPLASGGITVDEIRAMGSSVMTIAVGRSLANAAMIIEAGCGVPYRVFDGLCGLAATDRLMETLMGISGQGMGGRLKRGRRALVDGTRDAMARVAGKRVVIAQEADTAVSLSAIIAEAGARVVLAVVPVETPAVKDILADEVVIGDYGCINGDADLLISGSHGRMAAEALGIPHLEWGFPVFERLGHNATVSVGYRGGLDMINRIGNKMMEAEG